MFSVIDHTRLSRETCIRDSYKGSELEHKEYEPLYACAKEVADRQHKKGFFVTCDTYVTMSDGTGIVHIAPAFGEDDANVGRKYDLCLLYTSRCV